MSRDNRFVIGDKVNVSGDSWSRILTGPHKSQFVVAALEGKPRVFVVLLVDCKLPITDRWDADTLLQAEDNKEVVSISSCNVRQSDPEISLRFVANGRDVTAELSEQSRNAILRAHLDGM